MYSSIIKEADIQNMIMCNKMYLYICHIFLAVENSLPRVLISDFKTMQFAVMSDPIQTGPKPDLSILLDLHG